VIKWTYLKAKRVPGKNRPIGVKKEIKQNVNTLKRCTRVKEALKA
jgi:hypothetical protein